MILFPAVTLVLLLRCLMSSPGSSELTSVPPTHLPHKHTELDRTSISDTCAVHIQSHCRATFAAFTGIEGVFKVPGKVHHACRRKQIEQVIRVMTLVYKMRDVVLFIRECNNGILPPIIQVKQTRLPEAPIRQLLCQVLCIKFN